MRVCECGHSQASRHELGRGACAEPGCTCKAFTPRKERWGVECVCGCVWENHRNHGMGKCVDADTGGGTGHWCSGFLEPYLQSSDLEKTEYKCLNCAHGWSKHEGEEPVCRDCQCGDFVPNLTVGRVEPPRIRHRITYRRSGAHTVLYAIGEIQGEIPKPENLYAQDFRMLADPDTPNSLFAVNYVFVYDVTEVNENKSGYEGLTCVIEYILHGGIGSPTNYTGTLREAPRIGKSGRIVVDNNLVLSKYAKLISVRVLR